METGDEVDDLARGAKNAVSDVRKKWKMKLFGVMVAGIGTAILLLSESGSDAKRIGIGVIVVGALMILGTRGLMFVFKQAYFAGKNQPRVKL
ncbi:MAG: hypothetical protein FJ280_18820 [Planctomycetes bacterium]|nr:hypothetical protein [Planctomycetota bacterium]